MESNREQQKSNIIAERYEVFETRQEIIMDYNITLKSTDELELNETFREKAILF